MAKKVKRITRTKASKVSLAKEIPIGIKIISVFAYVISIFSIFVVLFKTVLTTEELQKLIFSFVEESTASTTIANSLTLSGIVGTLAFAVFAVLMFFVARDLWTGKNWARVVMSAFFVLWFVGTLADVLRGEILRNVMDLVIYGIVAGYLLFNKEVQRAFSN